MCASPSRPSRASSNDTITNIAATAPSISSCSSMPIGLGARLRSPRRRDYAHCMRDLVDVHYPNAETIRVVQDNLSSHSAGALYEAFAPAEARRILRRLDFHFTPKHASWLNMVEIEIGVLRGQCLDRRIDDPMELNREIAAWERQRIRQALASIGCSQLTRPAAKWVPLTPARPKSHNHCAELLVQLERVAAAPA